MDITRAILYGLLNNSVETRNMFTGQTTTPVVTTLWDLWHGYVDQIMQDMKNIISTEWHSYQLEVQKWDGQDWISQQTSPYSVTGLATGHTLPSTVALTMTGKAIGKRKFGRKFFAGIPEMASSGNYLESGLTTYFTNALVHFINTFNSIDFGVCQPGIKDKNGAFQEFVSGVASLLFGTMVRRKLNRGI